MMQVLGTPKAPYPDQTGRIPEPEQGVIEEARRRQKRRRAVAATLIAAGAVGALVAVLIGGGGRGPTTKPEYEPLGPQRLSLRHGRAFAGNQPALIGVTMSLQAGNVGVCVGVVGGQDCNGPPATAAFPIWGGEQGYSPEERVGPEGEINAIFTGPGVAAVRVAHLGTFKAQPAPYAPPGAKEIVFYRPPGSRGTVLAPGLSPRILERSPLTRGGPALTETLLDASGHPIRLGTPPATFTLPIGYWQAPHTAPARGRCALASSLAGVTSEWGEVATRIAPDGGVTTPAWLSCLNEWVHANGTTFETAVLLNAQAPGAAPAPLWGAVPLPGHPGIVEIPPVQREIHLQRLGAAAATRMLAIDTKRSGRAHAEQVLRESEQRPVWDVFIPSTVARRVGPAWVIVRYGNSLAERTRFLDSLRITKLDLTRG
jgi:hypothetical protein